MPASAGDNVHLLHAEGLTDVVELISDEFFSRFRLQSLFGPPVAQAKKDFIINIVDKIRSLGTFQHERGPGVRKEHRRYAQAIWTAIFQDYTTEIDDSTYHALGSIDVPNQRLASELSSDDALRSLMDALSDYTEMILRTNEYFAARVLSLENPTLTVGDITETLDFDITSNDAAVSWATASTEIATEFDSWLGAFRESSGDYPDLVLVGENFWRDFILENDRLEQFMYRNSEFWHPDIPMQNFSRPDRQMRFQVQTVPTQYENSSGTLTDFWAADIMSFVRLRPGGRSLRRYTVRDRSNNMMGGTSSYTYESNNPKGTHLVVNDCSFFGILNKADVELFDLTP